jgi:hypothetical protein
MGILLKADDITKGQFVAVHSLSAMANYCRERTEERDASSPPAPVPPGYPLRVLEVSLPFVACSLLQPGGKESGPMIIDLRNVRLCRLNNGFIEAIKAFPPDGAE